MKRPAALQRNALVGKLREKVRWGVTIIGLGATTLGVAVDAAARGLETLLLEQNDFAKGTFQQKHEASAWRCVLFCARKYKTSDGGIAGNRYIIT